MAKYKDIFSNHINDIIELIKNNKIRGENNALERFNNYLESIQEIGPFSIENWREDWRRKIWKFGEEFKKLNPSDFLILIDNVLNSETVRNLEVIEFIRSEIIVNFLPDLECKKHLIILNEKYPLNPEFRNTLGHYYVKDKQLLLSIEQYKIATKMDPTNNSFINSRYKQEQTYLNDLIITGEYKTGKDHINKILTENDPIFLRLDIRKTFTSYIRRLDDHLYFKDKLESIEKDFKEKMHNELENERKRIIEVLGFFSAIVAFILSTVSIGKNFSFLEAIYFIIALGLILILFTVSLSVIFSPSKKQLFSDKKFWILIILILTLLIFILLASSISTTLNKLF